VHTCTDVPRARWRARLLFVVAYWNAISVIEWCGDKSYATKKLAGDLSSGTAGIRERRRSKLDTSCFDYSIIAVRWLKKYVYLLLCFPPPKIVTINSGLKFRIQLSVYDINNISLIFQNNSLSILNIYIINFFSFVNIFFPYRLIKLKEARAIVDYLRKYQWWVSVNLTRACARLRGIHREYLIE